MPTWDTGTIVSLLIGAAVAYREWKLLRANRRKVLAEGSDLSTQAADRMLNHWEADNQRLREDNQRLGARLAVVERRCDRLEDLLREHHIPVPAVD